MRILSWLLLILAVLAGIASFAFNGGVGYRGSISDSDARSLVASFRSPRVLRDF